MKGEVSICLYSSENPNECVLSIRLNTEQSIDECQDVILSLFPKLRQLLRVAPERIHNDDVNF